jgi:hypothetical protein
MEALYHKEIVLNSLTQVRFSDLAHTNKIQQEITVLKVNPQTSQAILSLAQLKRSQINQNNHTQEFRLTMVVQDQIHYIQVRSNN